MFEAYVLQAFPFTQAKASFHLGKLNPIPKSEKLFFHVFFLFLFLFGLWMVPPKITIIWSIWGMKTHMTETYWDHTMGVSKGWTGMGWISYSNIALLSLNLGFDQKFHKILSASWWFSQLPRLTDAPMVAVDAAGAAYHHKARQAPWLRHLGAGLVDLVVTRVVLRFGHDLEKAIDAANVGWENPLEVGRMIWNTWKIKVVRSWFQMF